MTHNSKLQFFNKRCSFQRAVHLPLEHLHNISFYAFWRLFDVHSNRLSRRQREAIVSISGTGWPSQAQKIHPRHLYYAKHTLYAYMPCLGDRGTDYIDECVDEFYGGSWREALKAFVLDVDNVWCPKWIRRNYEVQNQIDTLQSDATNKPHDAADALCKKCLMPNTNQENDKTCAEFLHAQKFKTSFQFDDGEPNVSEDDDRPETYDFLQWRKENREP